MIAFAYDLPFQGGRLSGGPDWIRSPNDAYDIEAKADEATLAALPAKDRTQALRKMLQALLAERFGLVMRHETKKQLVYLLTVAKHGPRFEKSKLQEKDCEAAPDQCRIGGGGDGRGIHVKAFDMAELAVFVSNFTDRPLIDRTRLTGFYDIDTEGWVPMRPRPVVPGRPATAEDRAFADPGRPTLFMILQKLGLKMRPSRAPVEMFVIVRVVRPTGN